MPAPYTVTLNGGGSATITPLTHVTDGEDDTLTLVSFGQPLRGGTLVEAPAGTLTYTPPSSLSGTDSFSYVVSDGTTDVSGSVTLDVDAVGVADTAQTSTGLPVTFSLLDNDHASRSFGQTVAVSTPPEHGSVSFQSFDPMFMFGLGKDIPTYTPVAGFSGVDTFAYTATDAYAQPFGATATVTVLPRVQADHAYTDAGEPTDIDVLSNDGGSGIAVAVATPPAARHGRGHRRPARALRPCGGLQRRGPLHLHRHGHATACRVTAGVDVSVDYVANPEFLTTVRETPLVIDVFANDLGDGSTLQLVPVNNLSFGDPDDTGLPLHGTVTLVDGKLRYVPAPGFVGQDQFNYHAASTATAASRAASWWSR